MNNINMKIIMYIRNSFNLLIVINMFYRQYYNFFYKIYSKIIKINFVNYVIAILFKSIQMNIITISTINFFN